jgi:hypothetical protein
MNFGEICRHQISIQPTEEVSQDVFSTTRVGGGRRGYKKLCGKFMRLHDVAVDRLTPNVVAHSCITFKTLAAFARQLA